MQSVIVEPTKLILIGTLTTYQATGDTYSISVVLKYTISNRASPGFCRWWPLWGRRLQCRRRETQGEVHYSSIKRVLLGRPYGYMGIDDPIDAVRK